jgi:hypothetical protein
MNTSLQASGGRLYAPATTAFPWRVVVHEEIDGVWTVAQVFEAESYAEAEFEAQYICTEPFAPGVTAMHFVIGEAVQ